MGAGVAFILAISLLMSYTIMALGYWEESKPSEIRVAGKVMCQDCTQGWNKWVQGAKPIKGSVVSLTCMDNVRSKVVHYARDTTDELGQFDFSVNLDVCRKKIDPKRCRARLVSSPDPSCNILTDFAGGLTGVKLSSPSSVYRNTIKYDLGSFYFTSPMCKKPDYTSNNSQDGNGYGNKGHY
ncbi:hypothetical protein L484_015519 [Morus notabilis]|uniref:Pistil-specific extensin-like protein n=1 Tax=Morus notabilis TaxID=981085 RepID=W9S856_9ROSA|nr:non-classical arabinogalactan protein 30 [Morus notabilis]EXB93972.1 hypothetical protein L484_015519 [Morus notabilis]